MKKSILTMGLIALAVVSTLGQSYIRFNTGYAFPLNSELIGEESHYNYNPNTYVETETVKGVYGTFGTGVPIQIAYGKTIKESPFGFELQLTYLNGKKYSMKSVYTQTGEPSSSITQKVSANSFQFSPTMTVTARAGKVQPFMKIGPIFSKTSSTMKYNSEYAQVAIKYKGSISAGLSGAAGLNFNPDKNVQFFTEVCFTSLAYSPKEGEITKYTFDGVDYLSDLSAQERKFTYKKSYSYSDNSNDNVSTKEPASMASVAVMVGLRFML